MDRAVAEYGKHCHTTKSRNGQQYRKEPHMRLLRDHRIVLTLQASREDHLGGRMCAGQRIDHPRRRTSKLQLHKALATMHSLSTAKIVLPVAIVHQVV